MRIAATVKWGRAMVLSHFFDFKGGHKNLFSLVLLEYDFIMTSLARGCGSILRLKISLKLVKNEIIMMLVKCY